MNDKLGEILKGVNAKPEREPPAESDGEDVTDVATIGSTLSPANKTLTRLHILSRDGRVRSYQYAYLDVLSTFEGGKFTLLLAGVKHWRIEVKGHGPKFWLAYDYITQHRLRGLKEAVREFAADGETVFTEIKITDVTPQADA